MSTTAHKKSRCVRLCALVEACFHGTHKINHYSAQQREINVFSGCGRKSTKTQRRILCKLCTYLIYRLNSTFFLRCKRYFQLENAAEGLECSERQFFHR